MTRLTVRATELFSNAHATISCDRGQQILLITRSSKPFERAEEIDALRSTLAKVFPQAQRLGFSLLNDYRLAPTRVHPAHEPAFARFRAETELGFTRAAHLVATPVGRIRSDRLRQTAALPMKVFETLDEALAFLIQRQPP